MISRQIHRLLRAATVLVPVTLLLFAAHANAQIPPPDPSATPAAPDFIYGWGTEVLFPAAVRFDLTLNRPLNEITALTLAIQIPGRAPITVSPNPASIATFNGDFTDLSYVWEVPPGDPPPYLETVTYNWLVTTSRDAAAPVPGSFYYTDNRSTWTEWQSEDGVLRLIVPEGAPDPDSIYRRISPVYALLAETTGTTVPNFAYILFSDDLPSNPCMPDDAGNFTLFDSVTSRSFACDEGLVNAAYGQAGVQPLQMDSLASGALTERIVREMVGAFYAPIWASDGVPDWFRAGMTRFYQPEAALEDLGILREAERNNRLFNLNALRTLDEGEDELLWQAQSYGYVVYLARLIGVPALLDLSVSAASTESFAAAYENAVGRPIDTLLPNFRNWIYTSEAESDFLLTPYLAATPTPTPSRTPTPFPPTETYTPTPTFTPTFTPTLTPTPTVTGVLTDTPLPSLTPTITTTARPPTITPRPAGSLRNTDTAAAEDSNDDAIPPVAIGAVAAIFVVFALLTVVYLRMLRRRGL